jgi:hypothetical protein
VRVLLNKIDSWVVVVVPIYDGFDKNPMPLASESDRVVRFAICLGTYEPDPCGILKNRVVAGPALGQRHVLPDIDFVQENTHFG